MSEYVISKTGQRCPGYITRFFFLFFFSCFIDQKSKMSADPVLEEFPIEVMEEADAVAKAWIEAESSKEVVNDQKKKSQVD